jgi:D-sedoheptulose 7-phosphate isomerase
MITEKNYFLEKSINESISCQKNLIFLKKEIGDSIRLLYQKIKKGGKIIFCGNGGSAADAQHFAAELLIRLRPKVNRKPIKAVSLVLDTSTITACGNDYSFDEIFSRPFEALGEKNDVLFAISTSGNSKNILKVLKKSKRMNIPSISLLGFDGGRSKKYSNVSLIVNSNSVARIQEAHTFLGHYIIEQVENLVLKKKKLR